MSNKLDRMVLVLNKGWTPIHVTTVREAISDVAAGNAQFMDYDLALHDWASWVTLNVPDGEDGIQPVRGHAIRIPLVMRLKVYNQMKATEIKLNRKNVFLRDGFKCQYCSKEITLHTGTIDHVVPKSRGGKNSWDNFAASCKKCNTKKRDLTPKEAGLPSPKVGRPKWYALATRINSNAPEFWWKFLPESARLPAY